MEFEIKEKPSYLKSTNSVFSPGQGKLLIFFYFNKFKNSENNILFVNRYVDFHKNIKSYSCYGNVIKQM